jgi:TolA-binding protein
MKGYRTLAAGFLVVVLFFSAPSGAQQSEPQAKAPKLTLNSVEAQVTALQSQVSSQQSTITSLQSTINSLQSTVTSLKSALNTTTSFEVVGSDGAFLRGSPDAAEPSHPGTGQYEVAFTKDVSKCAYSVTPIGTLVFTEAIPDATNSRVLDVFSTDRSGDLQDTEFSILVVCT